MLCVFVSLVFVVVIISPLNCFWLWRVVVVVDIERESRRESWFLCRRSYINIEKSVKVNMI